MTCLAELTAPELYLQAEGCTGRYCPKHGRINQEIFRRGLPRREADWRIRSEANRVGEA